MTKPTFSDAKHWLRTARTITEALPFMRRFAGKTIVVKYGGHAMGDPALAKVFASDIVLLKQVGIHPVVVHGGGPEIARMLDRLDIESEFVDGRRVTNAKAIEVVEMVLSGTINKRIVAAVNAAGGTAIGVSGKDGGMIQADRLRRRVSGDSSNAGKFLDFGFVGEPRRIDPRILDSLQQSGMIPVIAPIGVGPAGETLNINADTVAGAVASAAGAARLLLLTDVTGVLDKQGRLVPDLSTVAAHALLRDGAISGGMIPKVETCAQAVKNGVDAAVILDGRMPHVLLLEIFTDRGIGTMIRDPEGTPA